MTVPVFRLYVLGSPDKQSRLSLTILAEFQAARAIERISLPPAWRKALQQRLSDLRGFIESGEPELTPESLQQLGGYIFEAVITGAVRDLFQKAAGRESTRLPCELLIESSAIAEWPWEYLFDPTTRRFICQDFHPISRGVFTQALPAPTGRLRTKARVLLIIGVLPEDEETDPEEQFASISNAFQTYIASGAVELDYVQGRSAQDIDRALHAKHYHVVHFFGHAGFDGERGMGYLRLDEPGRPSSRLYAEQLTLMLNGLGTQLVFLNACETGRTAPEEAQGRASIAATLIDQGIPAVIATQFAMPVQGSHLFAAFVYNSLVSGCSLGDAMRDGRRGILYSADGLFFVDWGIPVLYTSDPHRVLFPAKKQQPSWVKTYRQAVDGTSPVKSLAHASGKGAPAITCEPVRPPKTARARAKVRVSLFDLDSRVSFLPALTEAANRVQTYFHFEVAYLPMPSGSILKQAKVEEGNLHLPRLEQYLAGTPSMFRSDIACCLTRHLIAGQMEGKLWYNLFAASLESNPNVIALSTFGLRGYARQAGRGFAKAILGLCLSTIVSTLNKGLDYHEETVGCLFDFCQNRDDIVVSLRRGRFDHEPCRRRVKDAKQLEAIDTLLAAEIPDTLQARPSRRSARVA